MSTETYAEPNASAVSNDSPVHLSCMEVRGGNRAAEEHVALPGLDLWVYSKPQGGSERGGDIHYVSMCGSGRVSRMLLADVSGHGEHVASTAEALLRLMRRYVNYIDQGHFVQRMNARFYELAESGQFATAVLMTFFAPASSLSLCNAGHPHPLYYSAASRRWDVLQRERPERRSNLPLGVMQTMDFEQFGLRLEHNDRVLCYTDAVTEMRLEDGRLLGSERLRDIIQELGDMRPECLLSALVTTLRERYWPNPEDDDITLVLIQANGDASYAPLSERLKTPFRMGKAIWRSLTWENHPMPWPEMSAPNILGGMARRFNRLWKPPEDMVDPIDESEKQ